LRRMGQGVLRCRQNFFRMLSWLVWLPRRVTSRWRQCVYGRGAPIVENAASLHQLAEQPLAVDWSCPA
jgi:hypothetical protein